MKTLKTLSVKFLGIVMIAGLAAGCASVTDATFAEPAEPVAVDQPAPDDTANGDEPSVIVDKP